MGQGDVEELKKRRLNEECAALFDAVRYLTIKGEAYVGELRRELASVARLPIHRMRELLNEAVAKGELGSEVRNAPFRNGVRSTWQRRYYWIRK